MNKWLIMGSAGTIVVAGGLLYTYLKSRSKAVNRITLEELIEQFSNRTDRVILEELAKGGLTYVSGQTSVQLDESEQHILVVSDYYFKNEQDEWVKKTNKDAAPASIVTIEALQELRAKEVLLFDIEAPAKAEAPAAV